MRYVGPMKHTKNASRYLKPLGGLAFLDKVNADLLTLSQDDVEYGHELTLGGVEWERLGAGVDRIVFYHGNIVLKFPNTTKSYARENANEVEFAVYERIVGTPAARKFAASLALLDEYLPGVVLVAVKVTGEQPAFTGDWREDERREARVSRTLRTFGIRAFDLHRGNLLGNKVIDYGRFRLNGDEY